MSTISNNYFIKIILVKSVLEKGSKGTKKKKNYS